MVDISNPGHRIAKIKSVNMLFKKMSKINSSQYFVLYTVYLQEHGEAVFLANDLPLHTLAPRHEMLNKIRKHFAELHSVFEGKVVGVDVVGIPGSGKTVLATQYCHKYKSDYRVVLHLDVSSIEKLHYSLVQVAMNSFFGQTFDKQLIMEANVQSTTVLLEQLRNRLMNVSNWLIHVDSIGNYFEILPGLLPVPGSSGWGVNGSLIVATTERDLKGYKKFSRMVELGGGLTHREARNLLAEISNDRQSEGIDKVATELERLPLGLVAIAMYHGSRREAILSWTWIDSLRKYSKVKKSLKPYSETSPYRKSLIQAVEMKARENIEDTSSSKGVVLILFGLLNSSRLPENFVLSFGEALNVQSATDTIIDRLSLVNLEKGNVSFFTLHQVTQHVVKQIVSDMVKGVHYHKNVEAITDALIDTHIDHSKKRTEANSIMLRSLRSYFLRFSNHSLISVDKRVMLYRALGDISVLMSDGELARLRYTSLALEIMEQHDSQLSACEKTKIYLQGLMSAVNLVNGTAAETFYRAGLNVLLKREKDDDSECFRTVMGNLHYHYGSLLKTKGAYSAAEKFLKKAQWLLCETKSSECYYAREGLYESQKNKRVYDCQERPCSIALRSHTKRLHSLLASAMNEKYEKLIAHLQSRLAVGYLNNNNLSKHEVNLLLKYSFNSSQQYKTIYGESHSRYAQSTTTHAMGLLYVGKLDEACDFLNLAEKSLSNSGNMEYNTYGYWAVSKAHYFIRLSCGKPNMSEKKDDLMKASSLIQKSYNLAVRKLNHHHPEAAASMMAISYLYVRRAVLEVNETRRLLLRLAFHTFQIASRIRKQSDWRLPCCQLRFPCRRSQWFVLEVSKSEEVPSLGSCMTGKEAVHFKVRKRKHKLFVKRFQ